MTQPLTDTELKAIAERAEAMPREWSLSDISDFIVAARSDIPRLLAEIERLRAVIKEQAIELIGL